MIIPETISVSHGGGQKEIPFRWDGDVHQEALLTALVVEVTDRKAHFVITHFDSPDNSRFLEYGSSGDYESSTANIWASWSDQYPRDYRDLLSLADREYRDDVPATSQLDVVELEPDAPEVREGDMIHIHKLLLWGDVAEEDQVMGSKRGRLFNEVCKIPTEPRTVEDFFRDAAKLKPRIARQLARTHEKRERMHMESLNRILPNEPMRPFEDAEACMVGKNRMGHDIYRSRSVFGAGPVKDHYVDVTAMRAGDTLTELGGSQNWTVSGRELFTPNVIPFGEGSEEDPLYAIEIRIHSYTVLCPAVGEQKVMITIDGVQYDALKNGELSSSRFEQPGHDVVMEGVRPVGASKDTYEITAEQSEALAERRRSEGEAVSAVNQEAYDEYISTGKITPIEDSFDEADRRIMVLRAEATEANQTIATIIGGEPISSISSGAYLLIPRSMLDAVEIMFPAIE